MKNLKTTLEEFHQEVELKKQQKELDFEQRLFEAKMKYQKELQSAKTQAEEQQDQGKFTASGSMSGHGIPAKLPKLNISRLMEPMKIGLGFVTNLSKLLIKPQCPVSRNSHT